MDKIKMFYDWNTFKVKVKETIANLFQRNGPKNKFVLSDELSQYEYASTLRNILNHTEIINPNLTPMETGVLNKVDLVILDLKLEQSPDNVNDKQKRIMALLGIYHKYIIPENLKLLDETTLSYFNYYESLMQVVPVNAEEIDKQKIDKTVMQKIDILIAYANVVYELRYMRDNNRYIPIDFFIHQYANIYLGHISTDRKWIETNIETLRLLITVYAYITNEPIPEDYISYSSEIKTTASVILKMLNNILDSDIEESKAKPPPLFLVK